MQTISASYDPSVSGLPGNVGEIVLVAGGASAWEKFGAAVTDWRPYPAPAASASTAGLQSVADFNKLATVPTFSIGALSLGLSFISDEIDFTATGTTILIPPCAFKMSRPPGLAWASTVKDGSVTTGPTTKIGTNANNDDSFASTAQANLAAAAVNVATTVQGAASPTPANLDLSATGFRVQITSAAVLGTATAFKGRLVVTTPFALRTY